jgi:hypothetical protein
MNLPSPTTTQGAFQYLLAIILLIALAAGLVLAAGYFNLV